jgi:Na+-translocating ferredoxin:NAD+ oxidoreductase RnfD subunit
MAPGAAVVSPAPAPSRSIHLGRGEYPIVLPTLRDPRLHLAAVVISLQVLGQAVLGFQVSIAQILVSVFTCAVLEVGLTFWRRRVIMWPASAMLTGNGVAFILRTPGTQHGDWWTLRGAWIFAAVAAASLLSKYVIRIGDRHLFNPSNIGLVVGFLVLGTRRANPQDLWWGPMSPGLALTLAIIVVGGLVIASRLRMLELAAAFWITFAAGIGLIAASGHCMTARWHVGPVCGGSFWWVMVFSPEVLVFVFFMITDPKTAPLGRVGRIVYGVTVAFVACLLVAPERTEFATKLAILGGLAAICAIGPALGRFLPAPGSDADDPRAWVAGVAEGHESIPRRAASRLLLSRGTLALACVVACAGLLVIAGLPARPVAAAPTSAAQTLPRPAVQLPSPLPPVTVDPAVHRADPSVTQDEALRMGQDLIADLLIEASAVARQRADLAATAAEGTALEQVRQGIQIAKQARQVVTTSYRLDRITVVLVRDRNNPQAAPQLGVEAVGAIHRAISRAHLITATDAPYNETFVLALTGAHFVIVAGPAPS